MTQTVRIVVTVNLPETEYDTAGEISLETLERLVRELKLPHDWTSIVIVTTNPEPAQ
jgi:hypothetical protein